MSRNKEPIKKKSRKNAESLIWYQRFALFFFDKPRTTFIAWVLLLMFGAAAYTTLLQREGFPEINVPVSSVSGSYLVEDQARVDDEVVRPLTETIKEVEGVTDIATQAADNFFSMQVFYEEDVDSQTGSDRIQKAVEQSNVVPSAVNAQFAPIFATGLTQEGDNLLIAVAAPQGASANELQEKANAVASELQSGGAVAVEGAKEVHVLELFQTATNPATGEQVTEQNRFDWTKTEENSPFAPSAVVAIKADEGVDDLALYDEVVERLETVQSMQQFSDVELSVAGDFATLIRSQTSSLEMNMLGGLVAIVVISFLLISWNASIVSALSMITTLALTVAGLYLVGETLNMITLFSLILCLGLIVDDATIVVEAIDKRRGKDEPRQAVATVIKRIMLASTSGTLTTILAFAPLLFIGGIMGDFIFAIPLTIIMSLAISLVVSLSLVPFLARYTVLRKKRKPSKFTNPITVVEAKIADGLANVVRITNKSRKKGAFIGVVAIAISIATIVGAMYYGAKLPFNIFPATKDSDMITMSVNFGQSTPIEVAEERSAAVNQVITDTLGENLEKASYYASGSAESARITLSLVPFQERSTTSPELAEALNQAVATIEGVEAEAVADGGPAPSSGFAMQIHSEDGVALQEASSAIYNFLEEREIKRPDGTSAYITELEIEGDTTISRTDGQRYVQINAEFDAEDISALVAATQELVEAGFTNEKLSQYGLTKEALVFDVGQEAENQESFNSMMMAFPVLLLLMYAMLAVQFKSFSQPILIFLALPFSMLGVTMGLYYTDNALSFFVMLGLFALMGVAINNTILLIDYANQARQAGENAVNAMAHALRERFRPLLVTTLTTVVALVPLMLSDPFWESLAVTLAFGLVASTILVVIAFPYYYLAVELLRRTFTRTLLLIWLGLLLLVSIGLPWLGVSPTIVSIVVGVYLLATIAIVAIDLSRGRRRRSV